MRIPQSCKRFCGIFLRQHCIAIVQCCLYLLLTFFFAKAFLNCMGVVPSSLRNWRMKYFSSENPLENAASFTLAPAVSRAFERSIRERSRYAESVSPVSFLKIELRYSAL